MRLCSGLLHGIGVVNDAARWVCSYARGGLRVSRCVRRYAWRRMGHTGCVLLPRGSTKMPDLLPYIILPVGMYLLEPAT
jgi:hypothetical protein